MCLVLMSVSYVDVCVLCRCLCLVSMLLSDVGACGLCRCLCLMSMSVSYVVDAFVDSSPDRTLDVLDTYYLPVQIMAPGGPTAADDTGAVGIH